MDINIALDYDWIYLEVFAHNNIIYKWTSNSFL